MEVCVAYIQINYHSAILQMPVRLDVLLPQGRGGYKVLYLLHGAGGDHSSWILKSRIADYVEGANLAVIMPSGNNKFYVKNINGKDYFLFITEELPCMCQKWFNISKNSVNRFIAGMSMGGYGAYYAALKKPSFYHTAFSYSGLLNIVERYEKPRGLDMIPTFGTKQQLFEYSYDLYQLINKKSTKNVDNSTQFMTFCGLQDAKRHMSEEFTDRAKKAGYAIFLREEEGGHNWEYWDKCIKQTISYIVNTRKEEAICQ